MGESKTAYLTDHQLDVIEQMVERDEAGNESEALRNLINEGLVSFGYRGGVNGNTRLKWMAKELSRLFTYAGLAWLAFFWAFPVGFRLPGVMVLMAALGMVGCYFALDKYEPAVSQRLFGEAETI